MKGKPARKMDRATAAKAMERTLHLEAGDLKMIKRAIAKKKSSVRERDQL